MIGHLKAEHRMGGNHLAHAQGDAINAVLAAAGYNFRRLIAWLALLLAVICAAIAPEKSTSPISPSRPEPRSSQATYAELFGSGDRW
jgi:IS5 family transposase